MKKWGRKHCSWRLHVERIKKRHMFAFLLGSQLYATDAVDYSSHNEFARQEADKVSRQSRMQIQCRRELVHYSTQARCHVARVVLYIHRRSIARNISTLRQL